MLDKIRNELCFWRRKKKATLKQLKKFVGLLSHASRVVWGGKLFIHFMLEKMEGAGEEKGVKSKQPEQFISCIPGFTKFGGM